MGWSEKYKKSIDCGNPKGFSQRAHCQGRKKKMNEAKEKDHEVSMAQSQLKKSEENIRKLRKALGKKEKNIPAWVQAKITDTEHNTDAAAGYMDEGKRDGKSAKDKGYSLRDWFKGGGWVQAGGKYDGKPCAKQPGQKTKPFCRDADDRASMSEEERERRAKKKRREDPNPNRKGKAKIVTSEQIDATPYGGPDKLLQKLVPKGEKVIPTTPKKSANLEKAHFEPQGEMIGEEGKKDACYHKVKSRYSVWPSAYASGALVKCRKVGAANWGNKTKKEDYDYSNWRDDFKALEIESIDIIKPEPLQPTDGIGSRMLEEAKKCWKGYKKVGTQKLFGKTYNRCVKEGNKSFGQFMDEMYQGAPPPRKPPIIAPGMPKVPFVDTSSPADKMDRLKRHVRKSEYLDAKSNIKKPIQVAHFELDGEIIEDWQKVNKGDKTDGMSQKAVNAYRRENPGSKLKTAVTEKDPGPGRSKRRKSFCARSKGQQDMHNIDCSKTPDKAICKARRRWRC